jgi:hypothetical protein
MAIPSERQKHIERFYALLDRLEIKVGGKRFLKTSNTKMKWPSQGVYFFFEPLEYRTNSLDHLRIVRVGTHAVSSGSKSTLWQRLRQHGLGNHRASVFRRHIGVALLQKQGIVNASWGNKALSSKERRPLTQDLEAQVSQHLSEMPFLWVEVNDKAGPDSHRSVIEMNSVVLLGGENGQLPADLPSQSWLGQYHPDTRIQKSGLWNLNYVGTPLKLLTYDPGFLDLLEHYINHMAVS